MVDSPTPKPDPAPMTELCASAPNFRPQTRWRRKSLPMLAIALVLSGCASNTPSPRSTPLPPPGQAGNAVRQPGRITPRAPSFQTVPGLEGVIGADRSSLVRQFGPPRLDVWEGDARKLQFTGSACLLDIYLYPTKHSGEPIASYLDARRVSDGQDVDRTACVAALRKR